MHLYDILNFGIIVLTLSMFTCIYEKSDHYKKARASHTLIEPPIGY